MFQPVMIGMSEVLPHPEITPRRPDWLAGAPGFAPRNGGIKSLNSVYSNNGHSEKTRDSGLFPIRWQFRTVRAVSSDGVVHATPSALPPFAHCRSLRL